MTGIKAPKNLKQLTALVKKGESQTLEFKRSTGELKGGMMIQIEVPLKASKKLG